MASDASPETVLITLTGKDRPGVTSTVFATLAGYGVEVLDIEQIVLRRRLVLGVLVTAPRDWRPLRDAVERVGAELEMSVEVERGTGDNRPRPEGRSHVTVLGTPLQPAAMAAISGRIADTGANIDRIERMARYPVTAI
jgi:phosphoserine phosphatase